MLSSTIIANRDNDPSCQIGHSRRVDDNDTPPPEDDTLLEEEVQEKIRRRLLSLIGEEHGKQAEIARAMGEAEENVSRWLTGKRRLRLVIIRKFADALQKRLEDVVDEPVTVPVVGYVGAGDRVENFDDTGQLDRVVPPRGAEEAVAIIVQGDSMLPKYESGQLLYFHPTDHVGPDCIGRICIVQVGDGRTLVKRLHRGSRDGLFRLASLRAADIEDVELLWAARVRWTEEP